jgi:hypothetical protein
VSVEEAWGGWRRALEGVISVRSAANIAHLSIYLMFLSQIPLRQGKC